MRYGTLTRTEMGDTGTFGNLVSDSGFTCSTGELPWRENEPNKSSIPDGTYLCTWRESSKHGFCYHVEGVKNRTGVEIHAANWMGDADIGLRNELMGCIAPGLQVGLLNGQRAVISSAIALNLLEKEFDREPFSLTIKNSY